MSHLLLGFDIQKSLKNQNFLNPGTKISFSSSNGSNRAESEILSIVPRNCLHSIIRIIHKFIKNTSLIHRIPITLDYCYELIFILCSNIQFNQQLLNYLRTEFDFINTNLKKIPVGKMRNCVEDQAESSSNYSSHYSIYTWILNLTCIELQSLISNRMKVNLKKLMTILIENNLINTSATSGVSSTLSKSVLQAQNLNATTSRILPTSNNNFDNLLYLNTSSYNNSNKTLNLTGQAVIGNKTTDFDTFSVNSFSLKPTTGGHQQHMEHYQSQTMLDLDYDFQNTENKCFELFKFLDFVQCAPDHLSLKFFDSQLIEKVIDTCKYTPDYLPFSNLTLYDLKKLRSILIYEIKDSAASMSISRHSLLDEIKYILKNVHDRNQFHLSFYAKKKYFEAFRLFTESLILLAPCEVFSLNQRYNFLVALIRRLLLTVKFFSSNFFHLKDFFNSKHWWNIPVIPFFPLIPLN